MSNNSIIDKIIGLLKSGKVSKVSLAEGTPIRGLVKGVEKDISGNILSKDEIQYLLLSFEDEDIKNAADNSAEIKKNLLIDDCEIEIVVIYSGGLVVEIKNTVAHVRASGEEEYFVLTHTDKDYYAEENWGIIDPNIKNNEFLLKNETLDSITIDKLLKTIVEHGASDLHLSTGEPALFRIDGDMLPLTNFRFTEEKLSDLIYGIMDKDKVKVFKEEKELDYAYEIKGTARFRVNSFKQDRGIASVFRVIPSKILTMEDLGMGKIFKQIAKFPRGLVLVTGPTGSGKSTTLAAMIDYINSTREEHILTIEDPIEFVHKSKKSLINQRGVGPDTKSFSNALKSALREDPDVILVGELRDIETIRLAMTAAETGHVVFGTLHTNSASKTVDRIIDVFPAEEKSMVRAMLSESLQAVVSQTLLKKRGGGRVAAHEIMLGIPAIRNLIKEDKVAQMYSAIQTGNNVGMKTLDQALIALVKRGVITKEVAKSKAKDPENIK